MFSGVIKDVMNGFQLINTQNETQIESLNATIYSIHYFKHIIIENSFTWNYFHLGLFLPSGIKVNHRKGKPNCLRCMNFNNDPVYPINCGRDHHYCKSCFKWFLERTHVCLQCQNEDLPQGNQPPGQAWVNLTQNSLQGYEDCGVIILYFLFKEGIQGTLIFE